MTFLKDAPSKVPKHIEVKYPRVRLLTAKDYSKEKIGSIQPIYRTENRGKSITWLVKCDCGEYFTVPARNLSNKSVKECRKCAIKGYKTWRQEGVPQWVLDKYPEGPQGMSSDRHGEVYRKLTVVYRTQKTSEPHWVCKCECGNYEEVPTSYLVGHVQGMCSICWDEVNNKFYNSNYEDLPGRRISEQLLQKYKDKMPQKLKDKWPEVRVGGASNITGQRFGILTALYRVESSDKSRTKWVFRCDCGNYMKTRVSYVSDKRTTSCGCKRSSIGENNVAKILKENQIKYKEEFVFDDAISGCEKGYFRFDFAVFEDKNLSYIIEYDGRQHFEENNMFNLTLQEQRSRDKVKNSFCYRQSIPIIRIPYWKRDTMTIDMLKPETSKYVWPWAAEVLKEKYRDDKKNGYVLND